jgi:truncated hemoglobin YjbI
MRTLWFCAVAGGPFQDTGKELHEAHKDLRITAEAFDEVGAEIASALDHFHVPEREPRTSWPPSSHRRPRWLTRNC